MSARDRQEFLGALFQRVCSFCHRTHAMSNTIMLMQDVHLCHGTPVMPIIYVSTAYLACLQGKTPLYYAAVKGRRAMVVLLLSQGADLNPDPKDDTNRNVSLIRHKIPCMLPVAGCLHESKTRGSPNVVALSPDFACDITCSLYASLPSQALLFLKSLLLTCFQGQEALCRAICCGFSVTVELLLSDGADANSRDTAVSGLSAWSPRQPCAPAILLDNFCSYWPQPQAVNGLRGRHA